uniref:Uncharacterized protein n=1 Tax=Octopus bimaculoides TaxID=37653 RepID=A0A0L8GDZ4_OCTBM
MWLYLGPSPRCHPKYFSVFISGLLIVNLVSSYLAYSLYSLVAVISSKQDAEDYIEHRQTLEENPAPPKLGPGEIAFSSIRNDNHCDRTMYHNWYSLYHHHQYHLHYGRLFYYFYISCHFTNFGSYLY